MTDCPFQHSVAIDTNVFVHLLNPEQNPDSHIHQLLEFLIIQGTALIVDEQGAIRREYERHVEPMLRGKSVVGNELYLLAHWTKPEVQVRVSVAQNDALMRAIRKVIFELPKQADRTFVYVAFRSGRTLMTNDEADIVYGPVKETNWTPRRDRLLRVTRGSCPHGADILTSKEAFARVP